MITLLQGDVRDVLPTLPANSVHCCITSVPYYGLRSYLPNGHEDKHREIGLESSPDEWLATLVDVFREVRRVLRPDGTCWVNCGDSYVSGPAGNKTPSGISQNRPKRLNASLDAYNRRGNSGGDCKPKDLMMMPARLALALQQDGWWLRSDIIWHKPNPMPESVTDRPTSAHEHVFLLTRSARYFYDADAVSEPSLREGDIPGGRGGFIDLRLGNYKSGLAAAGQRPVAATRNLRNVWTIATEAYPGSHFATYPTALVERCIKAGCPPGGTVLDPFVGSGTTCLVADRLQRHAIGVDLNTSYAAMAMQRCKQDAPLFTEVATVEQPEPSAQLEMFAA